MTTINIIATYLGIGSVIGVIDFLLLNTRSEIIRTAI